MSRLHCLMQFMLDFLIFANSFLVPCLNGYNADLFSRRRSISFENADITVSIKTPNGDKIAEAFNATTAVKDPRKMRWVSLGLPRLLIRNNGINSSKVNVHVY